MEDFDEHRVLHELRHYLPSQTPLKDFIHHNSLHAFQHLKFYDGIFKASKIFGYQVTLELNDFRKLYGIGRINEAIIEKEIVRRKGVEGLEEWKAKVFFGEYNEVNLARVGQLRANWKNQYQIDLDTLVQPLLFRIINSFLDQGIALSNFPSSSKGFLNSIRALEKTSFTSFFKTKRAKK